MTFADHAGVSEVLKRNGMSERPLEEWKAIWEAAPFHASFADVPIGWVLETPAGELVGALSNVHSEYSYDGRPLRAAIAASWAVDGDYRGQALALKSKFFSQQRVDVLLNASASQRTAKLLPAFKATPVPHPCYDEVLFWITGYHGFARSALRKTSRRWLVPASPVLGAAWWTLDAVTRARWSAPRSRVAERTSLDESFDRFWSKLSSMRPGRFLALRSRAALEWRLRYRLAQDRARILVLERGADIDGYLLLLRSDSPAHGLFRYLIADLQVLDESDASTRALLVAGLRLARREGIHMVEWTGFNEPKRRCALGLSPYVRKLGWTRFYLKVCRSELREALAAVDAWDPSPFDSDDTI